MTGAASPPRWCCGSATPHSRLHRSRSSDGGFGVYIIREIMDVFDYTRGDGGSNILDLVKRIPGKEGAR